MSKNPPMTPENLTQRFKECMDRGMRPPFVLCMVSPNGSHTVLRVGEQGSH